MKVQSTEFLKALSKVNALVSKSNLMEELRVFFIIPEEETNTLLVCGTDSTMTLIERIPYEPSPTSDGSRIVLNASKLYTVAKNATNYIEFTYDEDAPLVEIQTNNAKVQLLKLLDNSNELLNLDKLQHTEATDEFTTGELKGILGNLIKLVDSSNNDISARTIFLANKKAVVGDSTFITYQEIAETSVYRLPDKVVKLLLTLLSGMPADSPVYFHELGDNQFIAKTSIGTLLFQEIDVPDIELDVLDDYSISNKVTVDKKDLLQCIPIVAATSDEHGILLEWDGPMLRLRSTDQDETAEVTLPNISPTQPPILSTNEPRISRCILQVDSLLKFTKSMVSNTVTLTIDDEYSMMQIQDEENAITATLAVLLPEEVPGWTQN